MKKIQRQSASVISRPPTRAPIETPMLPTPVSTPMGRPSDWPLNASVTIATLPGVMIAAPRPCSARAAIRTPVDGATPESIEPEMKITTPARNTRRRPSRSPARPPTIANVPIVSR